MHHAGALLYLFECLSEFKFKFEFIWLGFELEIEIGNRIRIRKGKPAQNLETSPARPTSSSNPNSPAHTFPRGPLSHRQPSSFSPRPAQLASPRSGPNARARAQRTSPLRVARPATDRPGPLVSGLPSTFLLQPRDDRIPLLAGPAAPELACPRATPPPQGPLASPSERPSLLEASPTRAGSNQNRCRDPVSPLP